MKSIFPGKMHRNITYKMRTAPQCQTFFFKTCSTASAVSHPPGCLCYVTLCLLCLFCVCVCVSNISIDVKLVLCLLQGAHGHLDGMGQRKPIQVAVQMYLQFLNRDGVWLTQEPPCVFSTRITSEFELST